MPRAKKSKVVKHESKTQQSTKKEPDNALKINEQLQTDNADSTVEAANVNGEQTTVTTNDLVDNAPAKATQHEHNETSEIEPNRALEIEPNEPRLSATNGSDGDASNTAVRENAEQPPTTSSTDGNTSTTTSSGRTVTARKEIQSPVPVIWTEGELNKLLRGVKKYGQNDYINLAILIRTKNPHQVEDHLKRLLARKARTTHVPIKTKAPIECWLQIIDDIVAQEADYSGILARIMALAGHFEPHDKLKESKRTPNYSNIYKYIAALMSCETPPPVTSIEAAVLLDLIQDLSEQLKSLDTTAQRDFLLHKCAELQTKRVDTKTERHDGSGDASTSRATGGNDTSPSEAATAGDKRPALFSINPFAIPVKLLRLDKPE